MKHLLRAWLWALVALTACERPAGVRPEEVPPTPAVAPEKPSAPAPAASPNDVPLAAPVAPGVGGPDFASLADRVVPAVVSIRVEQRIQVPRRMPGGDPLDVFRFFGQEPPREYRSSGLGSGFVIHADGLILTNAHVVENAESIEVTLMRPDGTERVLAARMLGITNDYDVAVIKTTEVANAPTVTLGDSDTLRIGEWVMAVGNPFGLEHSVSVGIISAKQRRDIDPSGRHGFYDFLQTDASINPGNSGGPLTNARGEVIGINSAVSAQGQGIGFAIPINMVKQLLPELEKNGRFVRSWVGLQAQPLTDDLAKSFGVGGDTGVLVSYVLPDGPAARGGLREGDIILEFDGKKLLRPTDLQLFASIAGVGNTVKLKIWRDGQVINTDIKLEAFHDKDHAEAQVPQPREEPGAVGLGLTLSNLTPNLRSQLGVETVRGAVVESVEPGSISARSGLHRGDVIIKVDKDDIFRAEDVVKKVRAAPVGALLRLKVERQGGRLFLAFHKP